REANAEAARALSARSLITDVDGVLSIRDSGVQRWLEETLPLVLDGKPAERTALTFSHMGRIMRATVTRAPEHSESGIVLLVRPRPQVLLVITTLVGGHSRLDEEALQQAFRLSPSEVRLCEALVNGHSLI